MPRSSLDILASVSMHRLSNGHVFASHFEVMDFLGSGSMGVVYRARQMSDGAEIALKLMHPALSMDPKSVHRFEREARAGMAISSPHVARVLATGYDEDSNQRWIAMELARGEGLEAFVKRHQPMPLGVAVDVLGQLFSALSAAHDAGVVHRDLKPDNITVLGEDGRQIQLKVLDFGIAKSLSSATAISTSPGQGTPLWTAPEQTRLDDVPNPTADVWALGLLTFFVFTGRMYWLHAQGQSSMVQLSMELVRNPIVPPSQRVAELGVANPFPPRFDEWFSRAVNRDPKQRFGTAGEALDALILLVERRTEPRYRLWLPVYSNSLSGGVAITHDVSTSGMLLLTRSAPALGQQVDLRFCLTAQAERTFEIHAVVVRVLPNDEDPEGLWRFQLAVEYVQPQPDMGPLLREVAERLSARTPVP